MNDNRQQRRLKRELADTQERTEVDEQLTREAKRLIRSDNPDSDARRKRIIRQLRETDTA
jgi:hypothetical protein